MTISPIGSIIAYAGKDAPKGWLLCNGKPIPAGKEYDGLRTLLNKKETPNLQGYFLRGLDVDGKIDPKRDLLSEQQDAVGPHTHSYNHWYHDQAGKSGADPTDVAANANDPQTGGPNPGANETRPKNVAVNFIIRAIDEGR